MRELIERLQEQGGLAWAFGKTSNYNDTMRLARAAGLNVRSIKKKDAGKHYQRGWTVMRIHGDRSVVDFFCDDSENGFRVIKNGNGPAPTSLD